MKVFEKFVYYGYQKLLKMPDDWQDIVGLEDQMVSPQICFDKVTHCIGRTSIKVINLLGY